MTAKFLKGDDRLVAVERLRDNQQGVENNVWKWNHVKEAMLDFKTWGWGAMMFSISVPSGGKFLSADTHPSFPKLGFSRPL